MGSPTKPVPNTQAQSVALKFATADPFRKSLVNKLSLTYTSNRPQRHDRRSSYVSGIGLSNSRVSSPIRFVSTALQEDSYRYFGR
eukprot:scaffold41_cov370-Pavlova_lutheri.AAC.12